MSFSGTSKEDVLANIVLYQQRLILELFENLEQIKVAPLTSYKKRRLTFPIGYHAKLRLVGKDLLGSLAILLETGHVKDGIAVQVVF